jgi:hypothetical protein
MKDFSMKDFNYYESFIKVSPDCPAYTSEAPSAKGDSKPAHLIQFEMISQHPYTYRQDELYFEVHCRQNGISDEALKVRGGELWKEFYSRPHACLRASALPKRYGWGLHFDQEGRIALYGVETEEYRRFAEAEDGIKVYNAMRSKKG